MRMDTQQYGYAFVWPSGAKKSLGDASEIYCRIRLRNNSNGTDSIAGISLDQGVWPLVIK